MSQPQQQINVADLELPQLSEVKKQLDEELTHLTNSFAQLKAAQSKFRGCLENVSEVKPDNTSKTLLVPLTNSLYVPGKLVNTENVIVDIGTGYYVSKTRPEATKYYQTKVDFITTNLNTLQTTIESKQQNMNYLLQVIQTKMQAGRQAQTAS
ncbi:putative prefoldin subunit 5 OS=Schizosaccharomyces pombe (strain 972 / ATCC 24843) GN=bob1 PE=1 SV=1 [Rhizoctonia solani AG-1 IB]|uniref:Putative prefoldin subunit 5 n=1 Tax=Thanatephorus cucumeris (strain AG1-IB / isolate 7/3/14) TaxID=1108050 RepID=A0A0B7F9I4_THACB|nr:putative prefoldin subunit 5 OS=Schizosaccharomyces pombe (strain 972 / ATCC 24843) GN=bob1 PE=1 SV=1 [Rhizoctonia solani AG-1 IB]